MIKLKDILYEIGDASARPFPYKQTYGKSAEEWKGSDNNIVLYEFKTTKGANYQVSFDIDPLWMKENSIYVEVDFTVDGSMDDTNLGEQYQVMSTITAIVLEFIEEWQKRWYISRIDMSPIKSTDGGDDDDSSDDIVDPTDSRRGKLYLAYIRKQLPKLSKPYQVRVHSYEFRIQPQFDNPFK